MKFSLNSGCEPQYLEKADEIKVAWKDRKIIPELVEKYPDKVLNLCFYPSQIEEPIDWKEIEDYNNLTRNKLLCTVNNINNCIECKRRNIKFCYGYAVDNFYELQALKKLGVSYVRLGIALFFQMDRVNKIGVPIRVIPNIAYLDAMPREDGVCGQWIRPEDLDLYEEYVDIIEFEDVNVKKEQGLYRTYSIECGWPGDLNDLITNLNFKAANYMLPKSLSYVRLNCGQKCQINGSCEACYRAFRLANPELIKQYAEDNSLT